MDFILTLIFIVKEVIRMNRDELEKFMYHPLEEILQNLPLNANVVVLHEVHDIIKGTGYIEQFADEMPVKVALNPDTKSDITEALKYPMTDFGIYQYSDPSVPDRYDIYVKEVKTFDAPE